MSWYVVEPARTRTGGGSIGVTPRNEHAPHHDGRAVLPYLAGLDGLRAASVDHPEYFWDDGIHLRPEGAAVYAELVRGQLAVE